MHGLSTLSLEMLCLVGFRPGTTQLVSNTVELLVHACSSEDRGIRLAASENLRKLIKVSVHIPTHLPTLQLHVLINVDVHHEGIHTSCSL